MSNFYNVHPTTTRPQPTAALHASEEGTLTDFSTVKAKQADPTDETVDNNANDMALKVVSPSLPQARRSPSISLVSVPDGASYQNVPVPADSPSLNRSRTTQGTDGVDPTMRPFQDPTAPIKRIGFRTETEQCRKDKAKFARNNAKKDIHVHVSGLDKSEQPKQVRMRQVSAPRSVAEQKDDPPQYAFSAASTAEDKRAGKHHNEQYRADISSAMYENKVSGGRQRVNELRMKQQEDFKSTQERRKSEDANVKPQTGTKFINYN